MENVQVARGRGRGRARGRGRGRDRDATEVPVQDVHHVAPYPEQDGAQNPHGPVHVPQPAAQLDLAALLTTLLHRIEPQGAEIQELRNQIPQVNENLEKVNERQQHLLRMYLVWDKSL